MNRGDSPPGGVAVIATACRFPGARDAEEFLRNLRDGLETIRFFSDEELLAKGVAPELLAHPALFVVEYALAKALASRGLRPRALVGHSVGEYAAACLAGVVSLEDALALVAERGLLCEMAPEGAMLAVSLPASKVLRYLLREGLWVAAVNAPIRPCSPAASTRSSRSPGSLTGRAYLTAVSASNARSTRR